MKQILLLSVINATFGVALDLPPSKLLKSASVTSSVWPVRRDGSQPRNGIQMGSSVRLSRRGLYKILVCLKYEVSSLVVPKQG